MSRKRVRALYLQPAPLFGGAERQAVNAAALWPEFGIDVLPMVGPGDAIVTWLRERGVKDFVYSQAFPGGWPKQKGLARLTLPWRYLRVGLRARAEMTELVERQMAHVIVASLPFTWITGTLVARSAGIPVVWRAGGARINWVQKTLLWLLTRVLRPDLLLCVSEAVRRTLEPLVPAPIVVVQNGVDREIFRPGVGDAARYRPAGARYVVGCAERLTLLKRPQDFVAMAARLAKRFPDVHFLLAGEGSRRPEFTRLGHKLGAHNLQVLGYVGDMQSFYAACDIVVLPSCAEGCPNVVLEAMAMGKAVVAADADPVLELVRPGIDALVYPVGNVEALSDAVGNLLSNETRRLSLADAACIRARGMTAHTNAGSVASLLKALVAERRAEPESLPSQTERVRSAP